MTVAAIVAAFALVVYVVVGIVAPRFATRPPTHLTAHDLTKGLTIGGLGSVEPSATGYRSTAPARSYLTASPATAAPTATAAGRADGVAPADLSVAMDVDHRVVMVGDKLTYTVVATNVGKTLFKGAVTINLHTPTGTLRCDASMVLGLCTTPGDYDGTSKDPNAPHSNPPGVTRLVSIAPGAQIVLETLVVQIGANTTGTTLHNHVHVDGIRSITRVAPDVSTKSVSVVSYSRAPDVAVGS